MSPLRATALVMLALLTGCASLPRPDGVRWDTIELEHDGRERSVAFAVPRTSGPSPPLVIVLHGAIASSATVARQSGFADLAAEHGLVAAFPDGTGVLGLFRHWNAGFCCFRAQKKGIDDIGLVLRVADIAAVRYGVDPRRVYLAGFSNGGMLATAVAAAAPDRIAAISLVGASAGIRPDPERPAATPHRPEAPVPAILLHGTDDDRLPFDGGPPVHFGARDSFDWWVDSNRATGDPMVETRRDGRVRVERTGAGRREVVLVAVEGLRHEWPSAGWSSRLDPGEPLHGFDGSSMIWRFLETKFLDKN